MRSGQENYDFYCDVAVLTLVGSDMKGLLSVTWDRERKMFSQADPSALEALFTR